MGSKRIYQMIVTVLKNVVVTVSTNGVQLLRE